MSGAMAQGTDILTHAIYCSSCQRCNWRFLGEGELCPECMDNPLFDHDEASILKNARERFDFMGWSFSVKRNGCDERVYLFCYKRLFNPEKVGEVYSQANSTPEDYDHSIYRELPQRRHQDLMRRCAAWLIAHWWEHYLEICPCLKGERDDGEDSNFRKAVIESLLWYRSKGF